MGFAKLVNEIDVKEAAAAGMLGRPLTAANVEKMLNDLGLEPEFATHSLVSAGAGTARRHCCAAAAGARARARQQCACRRRAAAPNPATQR